MTTLTDPAREFTDFCLGLRAMESATGAEFLAKKFGVVAWSTDFVQIIASAHARIDSLKAMIKEIDLDEDIQLTAETQLDTIRNAFSFAGLANPWRHSVDNYLTDSALLPIRMTSAYLRPQYGYCVPSAEDIKTITDDVTTLLEWLRETQLSDRDFIRAALIDGLEAFLLQLERIGWIGWPDCFDSLRAVVAAYMALERGAPDPNVSPPYEAMLKKVGSTLQSIFSKVKVVKDVQEVGDWVLRGYGVLYAVGHVTKPLAGLLTHGQT